MDLDTPALSGIAALIALLLAALAILRRARQGRARGGLRGGDQSGLGAERQRARRLNIPDSSVRRFVATYQARGLSEVQALRKLNDDLERDRARYRG